ncbi:peptidase A4 family-domain-containing protein [Xylariaceae sp. FL0255]|nr:peptidase A4 family-domain-containing protein [Xylariaceae sp. FL0255]
MKSAVITSVTLFGASAFAARGTEARWARHAARRQDRNGFMQLHEQSEAPAKGENTNVQYSTNWAGAVLSSSGYTEVVGTIHAPTPKDDAGAGSASAWVGIDGDTCGTAILQTGIDFSITDNGKVSYDAWYEWYPDYSYDFSGFPISAGDEIKMTVIATSKSAGTATLENLTSGKTVTHKFSGETQNKLCEYDAEWIVEDFEEGNSLVTFVDFTTVTFTGASAVKNGQSVGVTGAAILDIKQDSTVYTDCTTSGSSTVTCKYV